MYVVAQLNNPTCGAMINCILPHLISWTGLFPSMNHRQLGIQDCNRPGPGFVYRRGIFKTLQVYTCIQESVKIEGEEWVRHNLFRYMYIHTRVACKIWVLGHTLCSLSRSVNAKAICCLCCLIIVELLSTCYSWDKMNGSQSLW